MLTLIRYVIFNIYLNFSIFESLGKAIIVSAIVREFPPIIELVRESPTPEMSSGALPAHISGSWSQAFPSPAFPLAFAISLPFFSIVGSSKYA